MTETDYILQQRNSAADTTIKIRYIHSFKKQYFTWNSKATLTI